jgi:hypothetical protein
MRSALGEPIAAMRIEPDKVKGNPYSLYSRRYAGGIVYVNWTGHAQQIPMPSDHVFFDPEGKTDTSIVIPDIAGT